MFHCTSVTNTQLCWNSKHQWYYSRSM